MAAVVAAILEDAGNFDIAYATDQLVPSLRLGGKGQANEGEQAAEAYHRRLHHGSVKPPCPRAAVNGGVKPGCRAQMRVTPIMPSRVTSDVSLSASQPSVPAGRFGTTR